MDTYTQITSDTPYDRELARYLAGLKERCWFNIFILTRENYHGIIKKKPKGFGDL